MNRATSLSQELLHKIVLEGWPRDQTVRAIMADFVDVARRLTDSDYGSIYILQQEDDEIRVVSGHEEGNLVDDLPNLWNMTRSPPGSSPGCIRTTSPT